jgi:hypothetical protein
MSIGHHKVKAKCQLGNTLLSQVCIAAFLHRVHNIALWCILVAGCNAKAMSCPLKNFFPSLFGNVITAILSQIPA